MDKYITFLSFYMAIAIFVLLITLFPLIVGIITIIISILRWNENNTNINNFTFYRWLFGAGIEYVIFSLLNIILVPLIRFIDKYKQSKISLVHIIGTFLFVIYAIIWCILGVIIFDQVSEKIEMIIFMHIVINIYIVSYTIIVHPVLTFLSIIE